MSNFEDDLRAAHELRRMAELYMARGAEEKAADLLELAGHIEARMKRQLQMQQMENEDRTSEAY